MKNKNRDELLSAIKFSTLDLHKNNFKDLIFFIGGSSAFTILECDFRKTKDIDLLEVPKNSIYSIIQKYGLFDLGIPTSHDNYIENYGFYKDCSNLLYENKESNIVWNIVWPEFTFLAKYHNNDSKSRTKDLQDINNPNILKSLDITRLKQANVSYIKKKNELQQDPMDYSIDDLIIKIQKLK